MRKKTLTSGRSGRSARPGSPGTPGKSRRPARSGIKRDHPLLVAAGRFHGHIGPFLALGLRMGFLANEHLGREPLEAAAVVTVEATPPRSCVVDGIQYATGCTLGKGNIRVRPHPARIAVDFSLGSESIRVTIRKDFLLRMERELACLTEKAVVDYAFRIMDTAAVDLFEVT